MGAWNDWYHCVISTYGAWLRGDARGFRTRHHREHVEGDYRHPPAKGKYDAVLRRSRRLMMRPAVVVPAAMRERVLCVMRGQLLTRGVEVRAMSVGGQHTHVLGRFRQGVGHTPGRSRGRTSAMDDPVRHIIGIVKRQASRELMRSGEMTGTLWARRGKITPVADRQHQVRVFHYILAHVDEGAAVWSFRDRV